MDQILRTKRCTKCGEEKTLDCFSKDKKKKDGLNIHCKGCISIKRKKWKEKPGVKEKIKLYYEEWYKKTENKGKKNLYYKKYIGKPENKEKKSSYNKEHSKKPETKKRKNILSKKYREKPGAKEKRSSRHKEYMEKPGNKEKKSSYDKEYSIKPEAKKRKRLYCREYRKNPEVKEKMSILNKKYRENPENKEKIRISQRKLHNKKMLEDPFYRMSVLSRTEFQKLLFKKETSNYFPYTQKELRAHIESTFEPWMNWENFGVKKGCWSVDHIIELRRFYFISIEDETFKKCWDLKNLRALDHEENIKKGHRMMKELNLYRKYKQ